MENVAVLFIIPIAESITGSSWPRLRWWFYNNLSRLHFISWGITDSASPGSHLSHYVDLIFVYLYFYRIIVSFSHVAMRILPVFIHNFHVLGCNCRKNVWSDLIIDAYIWITTRICLVWSTNVVRFINMFSVVSVHTDATTKFVL